MRFFWILCGSICVALGFIGILVPLLPSFVFFLMASFAFAKSSPRLHAWLHSHPKIGPMIRDWETRGGIAPRAKRLATVFILLTFVLSFILGAPFFAIIIQALVLSLVLLFIWTRPD